MIENNAIVFVAGFSCHLAHLEAGRGGLEANLDVEHHQVDQIIIFSRTAPDAKALFLNSWLKN